MMVVVYIAIIAWAAIYVGPGEFTVHVVMDWLSVHCTAITQNTHKGISSLGDWTLSQDTKQKLSLCQGVVDDGGVALQLMYCVQLTGFLSWIVRQSAELENGVISRIGLLLSALWWPYVHCYARFGSSIACANSHCNCLVLNDHTFVQWCH